MLKNKNVQFYIRIGLFILYILFIFTVYLGYIDLDKLQETLTGVFAFTAFVMIEGYRLYQSFKQTDNENKYKLEREYI